MVYLGMDGTFGDRWRPWGDRWRPWGQTVHLGMDSTLGGGRYSWGWTVHLGMDGTLGDGQCRSRLGTASPWSTASSQLQIVRSASAEN